ncbi:MAG: hypothetical protein RMZ69_05425 [Nostoc sp. ChiQUE01a]|nr:hypothetical protein [Nostoc sp. ChiQUE01a]
MNNQVSQYWLSYKEKVSKWFPEHYKGNRVLENECVLSFIQKSNRNPITEAFFEISDFSISVFS